MTSAEKTKKKSGAKAQSGSKSGGGFVATLKENKLKVIIISAVCFVVILALIFGLVFGLKGCNKKGQPALAINNYPAMTKVSFFAFRLCQVQHGGGLFSSNSASHACRLVFRHTAGLCCH